MTDSQWGWLLLAAELLGLAAMSQLIGRRRLWWGFLVLFAAVSVPWIAYSLTTARWSFLVLSLLWATVHLTNAARWRRQHGQDR